MQCRLQRRDLQLPRAARRARGARPPLLHPLRHRGDRPRLRGVGRRLLRAARRHVRHRAVGHSRRARSCSRAIASARSRSSTRETATGASLFASELKSLLAGAGVSHARSIPAAVRAYVCFGYVPTPGSIFRGVHKLPPGHYLRYVDGRRRRCIATTRSSSGPSTRCARREAEEELAHLLDRGGQEPPGLRRAVRRVPERRARLERRRRADVAPPRRSRCAPSRSAFARRRTTSCRTRAAWREHLGTEHHELVVEPDAVDAPAAAGLVSRRAVRRLLGGADLPRGQAGARARQDGAHRRRRRRGVRRLRPLPALPRRSSASARSSRRRRRRRSLAGRLVPGPSRLSPAPHRRAAAPCPSPTAT